MEWAGYVACVREKINAYRVLVRKHEGKRQSGRRKFRWQGNIRIYIKEIGCEACVREKINAYRVLVRKHEGKKQSGRRKCRWQGNIRIYIKEIGCGA